jgi:hypothetical protein
MNCDPLSLETPENQGEPGRRSPGADEQFEDEFRRPAFGSRLTAALI